MKKQLFLLSGVLTLAMSLQCGMAFAAEKSSGGMTVYESETQTMFAVQQSAATATVPDGTISENEYTSFYSLELTHSDGLNGFGDMGIDSTGAVNTEHETSIRDCLTWDDFGLYFAADVVDATPVDASGIYSDGTSKSDCIQLGLDFQGGKTADSGIDSALFFSFFPKSMVSASNPDGKPYVYEHMYYVSDSIYLEDDGVVCASTISDFGYVIESFIPWTVIAGATKFMPDNFTKPAAGDSFQYGITIVDQYVTNATANDKSQLCLVTNWKGGSEMKIATYPTLKFIGANDLDDELQKPDEKPDDKPTDTPNDDNSTNKGCNSAIGLGSGLAAGAALLSATGALLRKKHR